MAESRVEQWKRKLLDLSLRNPLLNVRDSAKFLPLETGLNFGGESSTTAVVPYTPPEAGAVVEYKHGYDYEIDVGRSTYPIDIAVRSPTQPNCFVLGIECDGANYARQRTVRDRDILRESVLKNLGWRIFRAWSVDWAFDRERAEKKLLDLLAETR